MAPLVKDRQAHTEGLTDVACTDDGAYAGGRTGPPPPLHRLVC
jgi:hypothetical protein